MASRKHADKDDEREMMLVALWKGQMSGRLSAVADEGYCGRLTVREIAAVVLVDRLNFPKGLDTPLCIGDFEGNFCAKDLSITLGGEGNDHLCLTGDAHC